MNIKRIQQKRTVYVEPYGRVPIRDATKAAALTLSEGSVRTGKSHRPSECAVAREAVKTPEAFPGHMLCAWTYKSYTLIVTRINDVLQARRYVHSKALRKAIKGFDGERSGKILKAGDEIALLAPTGLKRLGVSNGRSNPGNGAGRGGDLRTCWKRGVFRLKVDAERALVQQEGTKNKAEWIGPAAPTRPQRTPVLKAPAST